MVIFFAGVDSGSFYILREVPEGRMLKRPDAAP